jgi:3-oxoacyl-[acyl-carrier protein] reductase
LCGLLAATAPADWDLTLAVNLTAPYLLCKAVLPGMVARQWGRVIDVASVNSRIPSPLSVTPMCPIGFRSDL